MLSTVENLAISIDALGQILIEREVAVAKIRAHQITAIAVLDEAQVNTGRRSQVNLRVGSRASGRHP